MGKVLKHQHWHFTVLVACLWSLYYCVKIDSNILSGEFWGTNSVTWLIIAILTPIIHQFYVLICWRYELHHNSISRLWGERGFGLYKLGFAILILSRPITIILLAFSNANTININPSLAYILSGILIIPSIYLFYSVKKYFGLDRAFGIDHFHPEKFQNEPMVKQGIFKYTSNGMYLFGFFILWIPGIVLQSKAALLAALFNHLYIWVHYYFTELPDMHIIYGEGKDRIPNKI